MANTNDLQFRATVAWFSASGRPAPPAFVEAAATFKYRICVVGEVPDIAIVDLYGASPTSDSAAEAVAAARRASASAGLLIAADVAASADDRKRCIRLGETVFLRDTIEPLIGAVRERLRLSGLADEAGDRIKTLIADGRILNFSPTSPSADEFSVLIAGKPSPVALAASNAIYGAGKTSYCVFSAGQAMRALDHSKFHAAVFIPSDDNDLLIALARALRRHREHRKLPVVIITTDFDILEKRAAKDGLELMASSRIGDDLFRRLDASARRASMAVGMRSFLRSPEGNGGSALAAHPRIFVQHASRVFRRADQEGRPVSFAALSLTPRKDANRAALDEALRTAARLVRAEDMIARLTSTTLIFMLRGVRGNDAERVARRLEGVIAGTQSRQSTHDEICSVSAERPTGAELEHVIAALVSELRERRRAAARNTA